VASPSFLIVNGSMGAPSLARARAGPTPLRGKESGVDVHGTWAHTCLSEGRDGTLALTTLSLTI
jgi:hypothetical protein